MSIAYSVSPKEVVRAGYGIFYDTGATTISSALANTIYGTTSATNYNVDNTTNGTPVDTPALNLSNILPASQTIALGTFPVSTGPGQGYGGAGQWAKVTYYDQKSMSLPYYQRMLFDLQRQIGSHDVITVSYSGVQGRKGTNVTNINLPTYQTGWTHGGGTPTHRLTRFGQTMRAGSAIYI